MEINNNHVLDRYNLAIDRQKDSIDNIGDNNLDNIENNDRLKELSKEFTSILLQKMLKSMRSTLPENKLISGGFAEDVFTDMYDREISKMGSKQQSFNRLSELLYRQLIEKQKAKK